jgi:hypothetical protein
MGATDLSYVKNGTSIQQQEPLPQLPPTHFGLDAFYDRILRGEAP